MSYQVRNFGRLFVERDRRKLRGSLNDHREPSHLLIGTYNAIWQYIHRHLPGWRSFANAINRQ